MKRLLILAAALLSACGVSVAGTGGSGGPLTNQINASYTDSAGITSKYHLFAAGLDWTKPVGLLIYTDGSGEYGLKNPNSNYLLDADGTDGVVAVARKHNMLLLTPQAPGNGCTDGGGVCWYLPSSDGTSIAKKTHWAFDLTKYVQSRYNIDTTRGVISGYSSGAQFTTEYFGPQYAEQVMSDGLMMPISFGGSPKVPASYSPAFKSKVPVVWDVGANDPSYTTSSAYGVKAGEKWYRENGFTTELNVVPNTTHNRSGQFDTILDREMTQWIDPAPPTSTTTSTTPPTTTPPTTTPPTTTTTPPAAAWNTTVAPSRNGGTFTVTVPAGYSGRVYVRLSSGNYLYTTTSGPSTVKLTFTAQQCGRTLNWTVQAPDHTVRASGTFTTLAC